MQNKPTLLATTRTPREGSRRILASLEHGALTLEAERVPRWKLNGWTVGLCVMLLAMTVLAWTIHQSAILATPRQDAAPPLSGPTGNVPLLAHAALTPVALPAASQAAAIINDTSQPVQVEIVRRADLHGTAVTQAAGKPGAAAAGIAGAAPATSLKSVPKTAGAALQAGQRRGAATVTASHTLPGTDPVATARGAISASPVRDDVAPAHTASAHARKASAALPVAPTSDTDVTLLTALVAHASQPAVVTAERSRDIVERGDGDTTAELLHRCKQLGLIEGMLCRSRICSGRWENDLACRTPSR
jgi:hypothetical protein